MIKKRAWFLVMAVSVCVPLITACNKNSAATEALRALRKIEAATEVGVSYQQYGPLVIEAQAQVNEAKAKLPDGELKTLLEQTILIYAKVGELWGLQIQNNRTNNKEANDTKQQGWRIASENIKKISKLVGE
jgi:hypothetical protein